MTENLYNAYKRIKGQLSNYYETYKEYEKLYLNQPTDNEVLKNISEISDPLFFEIVEHEKAHLISALPEGEVVPVIKGRSEAMDADDFKAKILTSIIEYQLTGGRFSNFLEFLRGMKEISMIYGTAYGLVTWLWTSDYEGVNLEVLNPYRCYPDIEANDIDKSRYFFYEDYIGVEDLDSKLPNGQPRYNPAIVSKLKEEVKDTLFDDKEAGWYEKLSIQDFKRTQKIPIVRCFTPGKWYVFTKDGDLLEEIDNPYPGIKFPIVSLKNITIENFNFGLSEAYFIKSLIRAHNLFLNLRMSNIKTIVEPKYKAKSSAVMRYAHTWLNRPDQIFVVDNPDDIEPFIMPDVTAATFQQTINFFNDTMARRLGRLDFITRNESQKQRTATELTLMAREQNARKRYKTVLLDQLVKETIRKIIKLNQLFIRSSTVVKITNIKPEDIPDEYKSKFRITGGGYFFVVDKEDIQGEYDYKVLSSTDRVATSTQKYQELLQLFNLTTQVMPLLEKEGYRVELTPLLKQLYKVLDYPDVFDSVVIRDEELVKRNELMQEAQTQQMEQQAAQIIGNGRGADLEGVPPASQMPGVPQDPTELAAQKQMARLEQDMSKLGEL